MPSPGWVVPLATTGAVAAIRGDVAYRADQIITFAQQYAEQQLRIVTGLQSDLRYGVPIAIDYIEQGVTVPGYADPGYTYVRPSSQDPTIVMPPDPVKGTYLDVPIPDVPAFPAFTIPDPTIVDPIKPDDDVPGFTETKPDLEFIGVPDVPPYTLPDEPIMTPVVFSDLPSLDFPTFAGERPVIALDAPPVYITSGNNDYQSTLLDEIKAKLLNDVINGGTGLGPEIEQDIWERNQERDQLALLDALERATSEWTARGFDYPNGMLNGMLMPLEVEYLHKRTDTSRDIAIKQAELAQANTHFSIQQGIALEQILVNWANSVAQRTFEASKAYTAALVTIFEAELKKQQTLLDQYKTDAQVFAELIKAEIAKLEVFRIEVEMNKGIAEYDRNRVETYKAQVEAIDVIVKAYGHEVDAVKAVAEIQKVKMDAFKSAVEAYVAQVNAKTAEYGMYTAAWNGEKIKSEVYATRVDAFGKRISVIQSEVAAKIEVMKAHIEANRDLLARFNTDVDFFKAKSSNNIAVVDERLKLFASEVSRYQVDGSIYNNKTDLTIKQYDVEIQKYIKRAELMIKEAELQLKADEFNSNQEIETKKAVATVAAHIAAGAMASLHAGATLSESASGSENFSNQNQQTNTASYDVRENYDYSE